MTTENACQTFSGFDEFTLYVINSRHIQKLIDEFLEINFSIELNL